MNEHEDIGLPHEELDAVDYVVSDGVIYEPTKDNFGGDWLFVRRGEFDESNLGDDDQIDQSETDASHCPLCGSGPRKLRKITTDSRGENKCVRCGHVW